MTSVGWELRRQVWPPCGHHTPYKYDKVERFPDGTLKVVCQLCWAEQLPKYVLSPHSGHPVLRWHGVRTNANGTRRWRKSELAIGA